MSENFLRVLSGMLQFSFILYKK